jgi:hypothetical protein
VKMHCSLNIFKPFPLLLRLRYIRIEIDLTVKSPETPECAVAPVGTVSGGDVCNVRSAIDAIRQSQQLGNDAALDLAMCFLSVRRNRVELVDEDSARGLDGASSKSDRTLPSSCSEIFEMISGPWTMEKFPPVSFAIARRSGSCPILAART